MATSSPPHDLAGLDVARLQQQHRPLQGCDAQEGRGRGRGRTAAPSGRTWLWENSGLAARRAAAPRRCNDDRSQIRPIIIQAR
jgi:hypothetical protein